MTTVLSFDVLVEVNKNLDNFESEWVSDTGKSLSEALILASTNPQYDDRLFVELPGGCALFLPNAGPKPSKISGIEGPSHLVVLAKLIYKFLPSQNLVHLSGYIFYIHSNIPYVGGGQLLKNMCKIL